MRVNLYPNQEQVLTKMHNGCILVGAVGLGKSITALTYYYENVCNGHMARSIDDTPRYMKEPRDLYIITTAVKRDTLEWNMELSRFCLLAGNNKVGRHRVNVVIDSWNNIKKYKKVYGAMFIFDEQRVVGYGAWAKTFIAIASKNQWILLSATPADTWSDLIPVFIANGFYRNKTQFEAKHVVWSRFSKYPKVDRYVGIRELTKNQNAVYVIMEDSRATKQRHHSVNCQYDKGLYNLIFKRRWNPYGDEPIRETGKLCYLMRKVVNSDASRIAFCTDLIADNLKCIIFYNYDYELEIIRQICDELRIPYTERNGHKHETVLDGDAWCYIVQYTSGAEAWNCIKTDTIIFYSENYSYKTMVQAAGRIDRANTPFKELHYYHLRSDAPIDEAIQQALRDKKKFNERKFLE